MKIPRDLKPGDLLWYSKTEYATVRNRNDTGVPCSYGHMAAETPTNDSLLYVTKSGKEFTNDTPPIIRIERIASAPAKVKRAKVDKWAVIVWCRSRKHARETRGNIDNGLRKLEIRRMGGSKP